jgi:tight adherence protein C
MQEAANPTLMGIDVIFVATMLAAVATLAVLIAIYAATTVRDPMAKRVKALNERREQLKAGITASTAKKRAKIVHKNDTTDKMRSRTNSSRPRSRSWPRPASAPRTWRCRSSSAAWCCRSRWAASPRC